MVALCKIKGKLRTLHSHLSPVCSWDFTCIDTCIWLCKEDHLITNWTFHSQPNIHRGRYPTCSFWARAEGIGSLCNSMVVEKKGGQLWTFSYRPKKSTKPISWSWKYFHWHPGVHLIWNLILGGETECSRTFTVFFPRGMQSIGRSQNNITSF